MAHKKSRYNILSFIHDSRSVGILLLLCTAFSMLFTNLGVGNSYHIFWESEIPFFSNIHLPHSALHFINDGLMAVFFLLAGAEVKREILSGELSSVKQAALPVVAAIFGAIIPAVIYLLFNAHTNFLHGWAIPTATDIAFSLGIVSLLGKRVPDSLRIFLTALAIIDDLIAIVVIALFYGGAIHWMFLIAVFAIIVIQIILNKIAKEKLAWLRILLGCALWYCMYHSGIHATVAGVVFAMLLPKNLLETYEKKLHVFVNFLIVPLFVLANTSIVLSNSISDSFSSSLSWGIILGLFIGKPIGIVGSSFFMIKSGLATMPKNAGWRAFFGIGMLAGIGFTMSIFVASLAFKNSETIDTAKIAVLAGSFLSMIVGILWLMSISRNASKK